MPEATCAQCGATFSCARTGMARYCSQRCKDQWKRANAKLIACEWCGQPFRKRRGRANQNRWCGQSCTTAAKHEGETSSLDWRQCVCGQWLTCRGGRKYCGYRCGLLATSLNLGYNPTGTPLQAECQACGYTMKWIARRGRWPLYCAPCRQAVNALRSATRYAGSYDRGDVYRRDGWRCHICHRMVSRTQAWPHPQSASIDHLVPISLGGLDTIENVACAHLSCNVRKSNRTLAEGEQLRLV